jgi:hydrogenase nickel incorporation protein HypA/HybF
VHELAITQAILDTALRHADLAKVTTIRALYLRLGALAGLAPDSIQFYFELLSQGTRAQGAQLHFKRFPPRAQCRACGATRDLPFDPTEFSREFARLENCTCGKNEYELVGSTGCFLDEMEAE